MVTNRQTYSLSERRRLACLILLIPTGDWDLTVLTDRIPAGETPALPAKGTSIARPRDYKQRLREHHRLFQL
jgi:hypothetical protein